MAKFEGIFEIQGTMKGMTFYKSKVNGSLIRTKGGVSKKRIMNDPAFARTRENGNEFKTIAQSGQLVRKSTGFFYKLARDPQVVSRMVKVLSEVKKLDGISARGSRKVSSGLALPEGKDLLKGFEFNKNASLQVVLRTNPTWDVSTGTFEIADFVPNEHLSYPDETTHVNFCVGISRVDFERKRFNTVYSNAQQIEMSDHVSPIHLVPSYLPQGNGFLIYFLIIDFKQEINGVKYPLKNNAYNVLHVIDVSD